MPSSSFRICSKVREYLDPKKFTCKCHRSCHSTVRFWPVDLVGLERKMRLIFSASSRKRCIAGWLPHPQNQHKMHRKASPNSRTYSRDRGKAAGSFTLELARPPTPYSAHSTDTAGPNPPTLPPATDPRHTVFL